MKIRKIILGSAALIAGAALGAQNLNFHGYMDYTNFAVGQEINKLSKDGEWDVSEASAEYGSFYNGRTELNVTGEAAIIFVFFQSISHLFASVQS